jgi:hypothetical protein
MQCFGTIKKVEGHFSVIEIVLKPKLTLASDQTEAKAIGTCEMSEKACDKYNLIKMTIPLAPVIILSLQLVNQTLKFK